MENIEIRKGRNEDLTKIKELAERERFSLGFKTKAVYEKAIEDEQIFVILVDGRVVGFQQYYHRKRDTQTTLYQKTIDINFRHQGLARLLVDAVVQEARLIGHKTILLKCPIDNESNEFHKKIGFMLVGQEQGKRRKLNIWVMNI